MSKKLEEISEVSDFGCRRPSVGSSSIARWFGTAKRKLQVSDSGSLQKFSDSLFAGSLNQ